jgi:hypothetical protein
VLDRASKTLPFLYQFCIFWVVKFQWIRSQPIHPAPAHIQAKVIRDYQRLLAVIEMVFFPSKRVPGTKYRTNLTRPAATGFGSR